MAGETLLTVVGNLTADPELRYTQAGVAVCNFTVASTPRSFDKAKGDWVDGETLFLRASVWREYGEHVAESLTKGMRVVVSGRLKQSTYETKEGEKRTAIDLDVEEMGPSLRYATAQVTRTQSGGGNNAAKPVDSWAAAAPGEGSGGMPDSWSSSVDTTADAPF